MASAERGFFLDQIYNNTIVIAHRSRSGFLVSKSTITRSVHELHAINGRASWTKTHTHTHARRLPTQVGTYSTHHGKSRVHFVRDTSVGRSVVRALVQLLAAAGDPPVAVPSPQEDGRVFRERICALVVRHRVTVPDRPSPVPSPVPPPPPPPPSKAAPDFPTDVDERARKRTQVDVVL